MPQIEDNDWAGVWIDHRQAHIFLPTDENCRVITLQSEMGARHRSTGGKAKSVPYMHESGPSSASHRARADENALIKFLNDVAKCVEGIKNVFLMGPGSTKTRLEELLKEGENSLNPINIGVEAASQMTQGQLKAKVLTHFGRPPKRYGVGPSLLF